MLTSKHLKDELLSHITSKIPALRGKEHEIFAIKYYLNENKFRVYFEEDQSDVYQPYQLLIQGLPLYL